MSRYIKALIGSEKDFLVAITDSTDTVRAAKDIHNTSPSASAAMGRTLTGVKLMSLFLKDEGARLSLTIDGDGEIGKIVSFSDYSGHLKIKVTNPRTETVINEAGKIDVGRVVGSNGYVRVIRDGDKIKPFTGQSELVSGEIAEDIANYYAISEQQPTVVSLGVFVAKDGSIEHSGGLILHVLPGTSEEKLVRMEKHIEEMKAFTKYLSETRDLVEILRMIFKEEEIKIIEEGEYKYSCDCSRERASRAVQTLSEEDKATIRREHDAIKVHCDYCGSVYSF